MLVIRTVCEELCDGKINVYNLENICAEEDHFNIILQEMNDLPVDKDIVLDSISLRKKQLDCYKSDLEVVQHFVYVCRNCGGRLPWLYRLIYRYKPIKKSFNLPLLTSRGRKTTFPFLQFD